MRTTIHFLGEETKVKEYQHSQTVIFPCPYEKTTSYMKGTANGPQKILEASEQVEFFDVETCTTPSDTGIYTFPAFDYSNEPEISSLNKTQHTISSEFKKSKFVIVLGGEHTISLAPIRAAAETFGSDNVSVLHFDAHSDMRESYEGNPLSHACVMRRIHEFIPHTYSVGIRAQCIEEFQYLKANSSQFGVLYDHERQVSGLQLDEALRFLPSNKVYVTFDLDYFSPQEVPSVGTPVPGGGHWYETLTFLRKLFEVRDVIGADVVELKPDHDKRSDFLAAQLVYKLIAYRFYRTKTFDKA